jgi:hypothetical protein
MEFIATLNDGTGQHEIKLDMSLYKSERGFVSELNHRFPTPVGMPTASDQLFAQCGLYKQPAGRTGLRAPRMREIIEGIGGIGIDAASTAPGNTGISRFVAPAAMLMGIQDDIYEDRDGVMAQFMRLVAYTNSVAGNRYERMVMSYNPARNSRAKPVAQLAEPTSIGLLTTGEQSGTIPVYASALEISDQALAYFGFAEVQKCMTIMATYDLAERADGWLVSMLSGDTDHGMSALSGEQVQKAVTFDSGIVSAGVLTQKAWIKWIAKHSKRAPISHIVCDVDMALAIQNRTGRPTVQGDDATSKRIDTTEVVMSDLWPSELPVYIVTDPNWPANTILGISKPNAIVLHESSTANFTSVENFITRRSTKFRVDYGAVATRLFDRAFHRLNLVL